MKDPLETYHKELRQAKTIWDKRISVAKVAYNTAEQKAWEKYQKAGGN